MRKIEVPTDTPTESELRLQLLPCIGGRRENRERGMRKLKSNRIRRRRGKKPAGQKLYSKQRREWLKSNQELSGVTVKW